MKIFFRAKLFLYRLFGASKYRLYYINGQDTLPPPLSEEEEEQAITRLPFDRSARDLLIEHNLRLVVFVAKRFENIGVSIEELISIGTVGLFKAVSTFQQEKGIKLATYASRCIENQILMFIRKSKQQKKEVSLDEPLSVDYDGNELLLSDVLSGDGENVLDRMEEDEERLQLRHAIAELTERERQIVVLRFGIGTGKEYTQKEVADMLGISQSYISRLEKKIFTSLRKKIEQKN